MAEFLTCCGYADYAERLVELGFDSWQSVELMDRGDLSHALSKFYTLRLFASSRTLRFVVYIHSSACIIGV